MAFTAKDVMKLRELSGAGMMDCKKALNECDGDMDKAMDYLREKSLAASAKKASRIAAEGVVEAYLSADSKTGVLVEVNCETDFVAKTDAFYDLAHDIAEHIAVSNPCCVDTLMEQPFFKDSSKTVSALVNEAVAKIGEKITVRRFARYEMKADGAVESYIHMGGKIGVMVEIEGDAGNKDAFMELAHDIAMHIAAAKPSYVRRDEVDTTELEKESEILRAQAINEGKPEKIVEKIVSGRIEKYYQEVCLMEQAFVKDPDKTITQLVEEASKTLGALCVRRFERYEMGEGLQKREDNFAEEVMSQMK